MVYSIASNSVTEGALIILQIPLSQLRGTILDIAPVATPGRIRLLDCHAFLKENVLSIWEFPDFPAVAYSVISYVWKGNPPPDNRPSDDAAGYFSVKGAEDGDDISIDVLRYACLASILGAMPHREKVSPEKADYLWIDRVCIIQTSKQDKSWQITRMFEVYELSTVCVVLPGGIGRVVSLDEETAWVHRAWTLQETLAPIRPFVLFSWKWGRGVVEDPYEGTLGDKLEVIVPGLCGLLPLDIIVTGCICGQFDFIPDQPESIDPPAGWQKYSWHGTESGRHVTGYTLPVSILGARTPTLVPLNAALMPDSEARDYAIWQSALARTSSRPVDMVFSIMGLFGIILNPDAFRKHDRIGATIALAQAILRQGRRATWLGVAPHMPPSSFHSSFPDFPKTSVAGRAELELEGRLIDAASLVEGDTFFSFYPYVKEVLDEMDEEGYVCVMRKAAIVVPTTRQASQSTSDVGDLVLEAVNDVRWKALENLDIAEDVFPRTVAIWLGSYSKNRLGLTSEPFADPRSKFMLVREHAPDKFHVFTFAMLPEKDTVGKNRANGWQAYAFRVGGPHHGPPITQTDVPTILQNQRPSNTSSSLDRSTTPV